MKYHKYEKCSEAYISAITFFGNRGEYLQEEKLRAIGIGDIKNGTLTDEELEEIIEYSEMHKQFRSRIEKDIIEGNLTEEELKRIFQLVEKRIKDETDITPIHNGEIVSKPKRTNNPSKKRENRREVLNLLDIDFNPSLEEFKKIIKYVEEYRKMFIKCEPEVTPIYNGELGKYPPKRPNTLEKDYDER